MFSLKPFQEQAIADLRQQFLELWQTGNKKLRLIFKSPTGSGKTIMVAQFLKDLTGDPQFDADKCFLWFSFSEDSYEQSKKKLFEYYGGASELDLLDLNDLNKGKLEKNNVFFINWQKIKDSTKEGRKLRRDNELGINFDNFIKATQEAGREMILIVDEAHRDKETELADEIVDLVNPRIILEITATPKDEEKYKALAYDKRAGFVEVEREEAVESGLIKEKIITQTKDDLDIRTKKEIDQDILLLDLAFDKRLELEKEYKKLKLDINPIVLIQLPNDDKATRETLDKSKLEIVKDYLKNKGVSDHEVVEWFSGSDKKEREGIEKNNSDVSFLIFKQAAATGWDCPRASILVMFREIKSPVFHIQTLGRILRMPEAKHYSKPLLNVGYLYTNYERKDVMREYERQGENKPADLLSKRKQNIKPIILESTFASRVDYNDLGYTFQFTFKEIADKKIGATKEEIKKKIKIDNIKIENQLIIDAEIENYDDFIKEMRKSGEDLNKETSRNDLERMYNLLCFNIIAKQEDENKKFAPERSWPDLKTALNVWLSGIIKEKREIYYKIIVNDLLKQNSLLKSVISEALGVYRPIREEEVQRKAMKDKRKIDIGVPQPELFFTDDYEIIKANKSAMEPFYIGKDYIGRKNEESFVKFLEDKENSIDWWYKNGDYGSEYFAIPYFDEQENKERLFYPDWIIKLKNGKLGVLDTKDDQTAKSTETKNKAEALQKFIKNKKMVDFGGIVVQKKDGSWMINKNKDYSFDVSFKGWKVLELF